MEATQEKVSLIELREVNYKKEKFWFFGWFRKDSSNIIGYDIVINTDAPVRNIYLNGKLNHERKTS